MQDKKSGFIRFNTPELASAALAEFSAKAEEERTIVSVKGTLRSTEGDEELDYYKRVRGLEG